MLSIHRSFQGPHAQSKIQQGVAPRGTASRWLGCWGAAALCLLAGLSFSRPAHATVALALDDATQAARSDYVVVAEVTTQHSFGTPNGQIYTDTTVRIIRSLEGSATPSQSLVIRQLGGSVEGRTLILPGDATFSPNEEVVLFLADRDRGSGHVYLTALAQSKYRVVGTQGAGDLLLSRDFGDLMLLGQDKQPVHPRSSPSLSALLRNLQAPPSPPPGSLPLPAAPAPATQEDR